MGGREQFQYTELFFWLWQVLMHIHTVFHQQKWWPTPVSWVLDGEQCPANGIVAFSSRVQSHEESWILGRVSCGMWQWDAGCCISLLIVWLMAAFRGILRGPIKKTQKQKGVPPSEAQVDQLSIKTQMRACKGLQMLHGVVVVLQEVLPEVSSGADPGHQWEAGGLGHLPGPGLALFCSSFGS